LDGGHQGDGTWPGLACRSAQRASAWSLPHGHRVDAHPSCRQGRPWYDWHMFCTTYEISDTAALIEASLPSMSALSSSGTRGSVHASEVSGALGKQRNAYALPGDHSADTARSAGAGAHRLWPGRLRVATHVPDQSHRGLPRRWRAHRRDRTAWRRDHAGVGDARVGLCRAAVHGASPAATPLVATLVASQATDRLATGVVHCPRPLVGARVEGRGRCGSIRARGRDAGCPPGTAALPPRAAMSASLVGNDTPAAL